MLSSVLSILHMHQVSTKLVSSFLFGFIKYLVVSSGNSALQKRFFALLIISAWMLPSFSILSVNCPNLSKQKSHKIGDLLATFVFALDKNMDDYFLKNTSIFFVI